MINNTAVYLVIFSCLASVVPATEFRKSSRTSYGIDHANLTDIKNYPYTVSVYSRLYNIVLGSGSVLNRRWILATATQLYNNQTTKDITIRGASNDCKVGGQFSRVQMMIKNLTYPHEINIALLKTNKRMRFNKKLRPIKMATYVPEEGSTAVMSGYGYNGNNTGKLAAGEFTISIDACKQKYHFDTIFCGSTSLYEPDFNDLGDPLVQNNTLVGYYLGTYDASPYIFMKVAYCRQWIIDTIKKHSFGDEADGID